MENDKLYQEFIKQLGGAVNFAIENKIPPIFVVGMLNTVAIDVANSINKAANPQPGQSKPDRN